MKKSKAVTALMKDHGIRIPSSGRSSAKTALPARKKLDNQREPGYQQISTYQERKSYEKV